jgi:hypothetical protein
VRIDQLERIFNPSVFEDKIGTHIDIYHEMQQSRQPICKRAKNKTDFKSRKRRIHQYVSPNAWVMRASALKFGAS